MLHSVIMAGGIGARFWPLSRRQKPKQLLDLLGEGTLLEQTITRIAPLIPETERWIVTNQEQMRRMQDAIPSLRADRFILEPIGRNTAPAIGLSAVRLLAYDPDAVMVVLPADHRIDHIDEFRTALTTAANMVSDSDILATIGMTPSRPETGYGYIQLDRKAKQPTSGAYWVKTFAEKPNLQTAKLFFESGEFLWNSGIFVWRADVILQQIAEHLPQWHSGLQKIAGALDTPEEAAVTQQVFAALKGISIDYGVMEHAPRVAVVKGEFGWSDVGSWDEVWRLLAQDENGNALRGNALMVKSRRNLILAQNRLIALVDMDDVIVVDAGDAILICPREKSQDVRAVVEALEKNGHDRVL